MNITEWYKYLNIRNINDGLLLESLYIHTCPFGGIGIETGNSNIMECNACRTQVELDFLKGLEVCNLTR